MNGIDLYDIDTKLIDINQLINDATLLYCTLPIIRIFWDSSSLVSCVTGTITITHDRNRGRD